MKFFYAGADLLETVRKRAALFEISPVRFGISVIACTASARRVERKSSGPAFSMHMAEA